MSLIPDEIKEVVRPPHTEVRLLSGKYYVVPYTVTYIQATKKTSKKSLPYCGIIAYNILTSQYEYFKRNARILNDEPSDKRYADIAFVDLLCHDLYLDLTNFYGFNDGTKIYVYSALRFLYGDSSSEMASNYIHSYISELYPSVGTSPNTVSNFINLLGKNDNLNKDFLLSRKKHDHEVLIFDGTHITCDTNSYLTEYGRVAKKTSRKQIVEINVYDTVTKDPIYFETIPGNIIDKTAFLQVLSRFDTKKATIIIDKGFNSSENLDFLFSQNEIKFIMPLNDNSVKVKEIISRNKYTEVFSYAGHKIRCFKYQEANRFYYVCNDSLIGSAQMQKYIENIVDKKKGYSIEKLNDKDQRFGVITFVSNLDETPETIYGKYKLRWEIEVNIKLEKTTIDNNNIRVHSSESILGVRFLEQIEMIMVGRVYFKLKEKGILSEFSIRRTLNELGKVNKNFKNGKWISPICTKKMRKLLKQLDIII